MLQKIISYIREKNMIQPGDRVLVGCSGGADSVCLLLLLIDCREVFDFSLSVLHVEHGIRGEESIADARFVENLCREKGVPFTCVSLDVPAYAKVQHVGLEEAARIMRYDALRKKAAETEPPMKIALAHHMEDNAETVLFQMARGSGLAGMCGIAPIRMENELCLIRPLLGISREEIEDYLEKKNQAYCVDTTNSDESYSRNRIRKSVLPQLVQVNSQAVVHMNNTAEQLAEIHSFVANQANLLYERVVTEEYGACRVDCTALLKEHPVLQREVLRRALFYVAEKKKNISLVHVDSIMSLARQQSGHRISLPYGMEAYMEYQVMRLHKDIEVPNEKLYAEVTEQMLNDCMNASDEALLWEDSKGNTITGKVWTSDNPMEDFRKKAYTKQFDYDKIKKGFFVRTRQKGDYFVLDADGHHKKLKDYMIDEKIPARLRDSIPVLAIDNEIIWLVGKRIGASFKVTESTTHIIEIQYNGGD